ncbi:peroxidase [Lasiodiplodia theobromae]|uniref:Peroxidase n=1 Tax=Lasiodiplodia theobromae TaxID=45133 RepID=A0A5N5DBS4_9PEZI|nr:Peroxidase [Lasiodiplodia theobromae]KAB2575097.1 Cytochrome c peroxidase [Lasiodiplodia theobromae]KAF4538961.1 Peroxidase [Lasiodiplodia theobromae]KAF9637350.1 peroxidase [Lasiodiplodia theobromae]
MASAARSVFARNALLRSAPASVRSSAARSSRFAVPAQTFRHQSRRGYSSEAGKSSGPNPAVWVGALAVLGGAGYYAYSSIQGVQAESKGPFTPKFEDYQKVYNVIAKALEENDNYDDGSYGPVLLRLAWHASGTYDKETGTGGSNGATMRFDPEADHGANAGLKAARDFLEPIKQQFPWISYSDLWTLAGVCAIQEMQGPKVAWRPGRNDRDVSFCTPDGRLPDASKEQNHLRAIFGRMGFNDQEIVALSGAHALGRCHTDRSGFDGPWTFSPTTLTNDYFRLLLDEKWQWRKWSGPKQFEDAKTKSLMMLPTDYALIKDKKFKPFVEKYAKDQDAFFKDFSDVVMRLFELGVPFTTSEDSRFTFKSSFD